MARAVWKGTLTFGLVTIPVELHTAVRETRPRFRLLHKDDEEPIRYERICQRDGTPVAWDDLVKGYEYEKGQFVVLTKDDFQTAALERSRTILILDFVDATQIDERFFETPYYLVPAKGGERSYQLLREALRSTGRTGIAKYIMRTTQHLAAIDVVRDVIVLTTMRFAEELADPASLLIPKDAAVDPRELTLARQLVEGLSSEWAPAKYRDEYRENLMRVIEGETEGQEAAPGGRHHGSRRAGGRPDGAPQGQPRAGREARIEGIHEGASGPQARISCSERPQEDGDPRAKQASGRLTRRRFSRREFRPGCRRRLPASGPGDRKAVAGNRADTARRRSP